MDMLWRALYATGRILRIVLDMLVAIIVDTIGDMGRMGMYMREIFEIASSELEVNPVFMAMFLATMFLIGWFVVSQVRGSLQSLVVTLLIAAAVFIAVFMLGM